MPDGNLQPNAVYSEATIKTEKVRATAIEKHSVGVTSIAHHDDIGNGLTQGVWRRNCDANGEQSGSRP